MSAKTLIEWTNRTWNPLIAILKRDVQVKRKDGTLVKVKKGMRGWFCTKCSTGCANCYAEKINLRLGNGLTYSVTNLDDIEFQLINLDAPLRWKKVRAGQANLVFVNSMTDLFHEAVPRDLIDQVFAVMALARNQTFQVLTKRAKEMREYLEPGAATLLERWAARIVVISETQCSMAYVEDADWPLPNVWLGVSVENQEWADARIPNLLETPAAVRFLSCEPLLGSIDLTKISDDGASRIDALSGYSFVDGRNSPFDIPQIDWVIVGGESGPKARPMHADWARSLRHQCVLRTDMGRPWSLPFFFKQWGEWIPYDHYKGDPFACNYLCDDKREALKIGKKRAGRKLDGREWNEMPAILARDSSTSLGMTEHAGRPVYGAT